MEEPAIEYYRACIGTWSAPLEIIVDDRKALRRSMGAFDAAGLRMLATWPTTFGRIQIRTSVAEMGDRAFEHTTRFMLGELELVSTTETIKVREDGQSFVLVGVGRTLMNRKGNAISGTGSVDETATQASYDIDWMGSPLVQTTVRDGDRVTLNWIGAGYHGTQRLERQS